MGAVFGSWADAEGGQPVHDTVESLRASLRGLSPHARSPVWTNSKTICASCDSRCSRANCRAASRTRGRARPSAAGLAASQRRLAALEGSDETRLLSAGEMAEYVGRGRNWAAQRAKSGNLIRVEHAGRTLYPAFQIDPETRAVRDWVAPMVAVLDELGLMGRDFAIWAAAPSPRFSGDLPARRAGDSDFLSTAAAASRTPDGATGGDAARPFQARRGPGSCRDRSPARVLAGTIEPCAERLQSGNVLGSPGDAEGRCLPSFAVLVLPRRCSAREAGPDALCVALGERRALGDACFATARLTTPMPFHARCSAVGCWHRSVRAGTSGWPLWRALTCTLSTCRRMN